METIHNTGCTLFLCQAIAILIKRVLSTYRTWIFLILQILLPIIFVILSNVITQEDFFKKNMPKLDYKFESYKNPKSFIGGKGDYLDTYKKDSDKTEIMTSENDYVEDALKEAKKDLYKYKSNLMTGAFFNGTQIIAYYNAEALHTAPLSLQAALNAILHKDVGSEYSIQTSMYPLPVTEQMKKSRSDLFGIFLATNIVTAMSYVTGIFIIFYVKERVTGAKHLQYVSGARISTFWFISYAWDFLIFLVIHLFWIITLFAYQYENYKTMEEMNRLLLGVVIFSLAVLPMTYLLSFYFETPTSAFLYISLIFVLLGVISPMAIKFLKGSDNTDKAEQLHCIFLLFPHYGLYSYMVTSMDLSGQYKMCTEKIENCGKLGISEDCPKYVCKQDKKCCYESEEYFKYGYEIGLSQILVHLTITGVVCMILVLLIDCGFFKRIKYCCARTRRRKKTEKDPNEDEDVAQQKEEINKISQQTLRNSVLVMKNVTKYYGKCLAVKQTCLKLNEKECFGLLGINGAGKTTTFKMLTGITPLTSGDIYIKGYRLKTHLKDVYKIIGYCPQFDALLDNLTGRETLIIFSLLRGYKWQEAKDLAIKWATDLDFIQHLNKQVKHYSGGNKRKLSTAVALLGDPVLLFLDEPSTGMDPGTKRHIWDNIIRLRDDGKCIILTSHSMEECEALCTNLAIMVNGTFMCIGSKQHLKNRFAQDYTVTLKLPKSDVGKSRGSRTDLSSRSSEIPGFTYNIRNINKFMQSNISSARFEEAYQGMLVYQIPTKDIKCSRLFGIMEKAKKELNLEDYSISQGSLEQIFLSFTKAQKEERKRR